MRFFKRNQTDDERFGEFWVWWTGARDTILGSIEAGAFDDQVVADINRAVNAIDKRLAWELSKGGAASHAFCLSPEGDPELRQIAIRWLASAPPADATWEFHASKQPSGSDAILQVGGAKIDLGAMRAISSWDAAHRRMDVRLWHPAFEDLPVPIRMQVMFIFLDHLLGEDDVERWVGVIEALEAPSGGRTPDELRAELDRRRNEPPGEEETWVLATGTGDSGEPIIVVADAALKRIDHPFADHHVSVGVELGGERGLPSNEDAERLNAEQDDLIERLRDLVIYAGRVTRPGRRTIHLVTETPDTVKPVIDGWAAQLRDRRIRTDVTRDMRWAFQRELGL